MKKLGVKIWIMLLAYSVSLFGSGMTEPYLILYLHNQNRMDLELAGLIIAMLSVSGVLFIPVSGWLGKVIGVENTLAFMLVTAGGGEAMMAVMNKPLWAFVAALLLGGGNAGAWNAFSSLLAAKAGKENRSGVFGAAFGVQNFASGTGTAAGGMLLQAIGFRFLFIADALSFLLFAMMIKFILLKEDRLIERSINKSRINPGFVFKDKALIGVSGFFALFAALMTGLSLVVFPEWATGSKDASTNGVGFALLANSIVIAAGQSLALKFIKGRRRTLMVSLASLFIGVGCLFIWFSGLFKMEVIMSSSFVASWAIIGLGEILVVPSLPALVNDLAPDAFRVSYNSVFNLS